MLSALVFILGGCVTVKTWLSSISYTNENRRQKSLKTEQTPSICMWQNYMQSDGLEKQWCPWQSVCTNIIMNFAKHDDVIKWKHFPRYWTFVRGIHRWPVNSPHKGQCRGALMFSLTCAWISRWVNNHEAGDLRRYRAHYDVIVMLPYSSNHVIGTIPMECELCRSCMNRNYMWLARCRDISGNLVLVNTIACWMNTFAELLTSEENMKSMLNFVMSAVPADGITVLSVR